VTKPSGEQIVELAEVSRDNWRAACALSVLPDQEGFVAPVAYYLALCTYGDDWHPIVITTGGEIVGFAMWAVDEADHSFWIGGLLVDAEHQRRGYGRAALEMLIGEAARRGHTQVALSYQPANPARRLYAALGFTETGEVEEDEVVARRRL
jgi:diamine N-acetyltransferase